jgi:hypothetical protein
MFSYYLGMNIFSKLMFSMFNLEPLGSYDYIFLLDDRKNIANVVGTLFFEEFQYEEMKEYLI